MESGTVRHAIRLGLHHVAGISETELDAIEAAHAERPFSSLEDFAHRTNVSRPVLENLIRIGAFDSLAPQGRRALLWRVEEIWRAHAGVSASRTAAESGEVELPLETCSEGIPLAGLRDFSPAEIVRTELEVLDMDVTRHLLTFYEDECERFGVIPAAELPAHYNGEILTVAGVKVATQTPAIRSGRRIIFLTLDDPTGVVDVTVFPQVQHRCARPAFHGLLLAVRGKLRKTGPAGRGIAVIAEHIWDLQHLDAEAPDPAHLPTAAQREAQRAAALRNHPSLAGLAHFRPPAKPEPSDPEPTGDRRTVPSRRIWHASGGSAG